MRVQSLEDRIRVEKRVYDLVEVGFGDIIGERRRSASDEGTTTIDYTLPRSAHVRLEVFNILGERVSVLKDGVQDAGYHSVVFDAGGLPSGVYFYRLQARPLVNALSGGQAGDFVETKKLILMR